MSSTITVMNNIPVVTVNGLSKKDDFRTPGATTEWQNLEKWVENQENYFRTNMIDKDEERIQHIVMNIDVRHWGKLDNYFKYNQQKRLTYEMMKHVLMKRVKRVLDPTMAKYDKKVDSYIDKLNIPALDFNNLQTWMKKLRFLCDGQGKEEYMTAKVLSRVMEDQKHKVCANLLTEIKASIDVYEQRIKINNNTIGKEKKKELVRLKTMEETISNFLKYWV